MLPPSASEPLGRVARKPDCVTEIVDIFAKRRRVLLDSLTSIPYPHPAGAFFAFADIRASGMTGGFCR
ncbi:MAG: hypothetical protein U0401_11875 [Anaerolineae bacterium]